MKMLAKTLMGLEEIVTSELEAIGAKNIVALRRAVSFEGDHAVLYKANLHLRTALKVLVPIYEFKAKDEDQLYVQLQKFDWSKHLSNEKTFAFNSTVYSKYFDHSLYISQRSKDAVVDQFRDKTGERPSVELDNPDVQFNIHVRDDQFTISLDSSGKALNKRGYRDKRFQAPLNECLAAGMIALSGWKADRHFIDPMCGSGTLLIEAALIATNKAPGLLRDQFGFERWPDFDQELFAKVKAEAEAQVKRSDIEIFGSDVDAFAIDVARMSSVDLGFSGLIHFEKKPFARIEPRVKGSIIIMNPPYDERIKIDDINAFYKMIGDTLKKHHAGSQAWILSSNIDAIKSIGLKTSRRIHLMNGQLECKFHAFDLYDGSKRKKPKAVKKKHRVREDGTVTSEEPVIVEPIARLEVETKKEVTPSVSEKPKPVQSKTEKLPKPSDPDTSERPIKKINWQRKL